MYQNKKERFEKIILILLAIMLSLTSYVVLADDDYDEEEEEFYDPYTDQSAIKLEDYTYGVTPLEEEVQGNVTSRTFTVTDNIGHLSLALDSLDGLYNVKVLCNGKEITYTLLADSYTEIPLAVANTGNTGFLPITVPTEGSTAVDVVLNDRMYPTINTSGVQFKAGDKVTIVLTKDNSSQAYYPSNVSSAFISNHDQGAASGKSYGSVVEGLYRGTEVKSLDEDTIETYKQSAADATEEKDSEPGSFIEGIIANLIIAFGELFQFLAERAFGFTKHNTLSLDALIFNRVPQLAIDLRVVFPHAIQSGTTDKLGYLADPTVAGIIQNVFKGLRLIAIVVYLGTLLYVGMRILLSAGTPNEAKTKKFVQYWITGVAFLFFVPYFLPLIPTLNNIMVNAISSEAQISSSYTVSDIARELGKEFFGEDAEVPELKKELKSRIEDLKKRASGIVDPSTVAEAEAILDGRISNVDTILRSEGVAEADITRVTDEMKSIKTFVLDNYEKWDNSKNNQYNSMVSSYQSDAFATMHNAPHSTRINLRSQLTRFDSSKRWYIVLCFN
jgi:hypothetical protein